MINLQSYYIYIYSYHINSFIHMIMLILRSPIRNHTRWIYGDKYCQVLLAIIHG